MEMLVVFLSVIMLMLIAFSLQDLFKNKSLRSKYKTNYYFIIFAMPVLGSLLYFYTKKKYYGI